MLLQYKDTTQPMQKVAVADILVSREVTQDLVEVAVAAVTMALEEQQELVLFPDKQGGLEPLTAAVEAEGVSTKLGKTIQPLLADGVVIFPVTWLFTRIFHQLSA